MRIAHRRIEQLCQLVRALMTFEGKLLALSLCLVAG